MSVGDVEFALLKQAVIELKSEADRLECELNEMKRKQHGANMVCIHIHKKNPKLYQMRIQ